MCRDVQRLFLARKEARGSKTVYACALDAVGPLRDWAVFIGMVMGAGVTFAWGRCAAEPGVARSAARTIERQ